MRELEEMMNKYQLFDAATTMGLVEKPQPQNSQYPERTTLSKASGRGPETRTSAPLGGISRSKGTEHSDQAAKASCGHWQIPREI